MELRPLDKNVESIFWAVAPSVDADFAPEDPLAFDYLAQQVGLWLFSRLTTRTNRAQNYAAVLYGLALVERAIGEYGLENDDRVRVTLFERWERFWALAALEFRGGQLDRGDRDAMRGVRGAKRAWSGGARPLPLDFPLISRQAELGSLGAYLSSLRDYDLVMRGSYRPTPAAEEIIECFWDEPSSGARLGAFDAYALAALDQSRQTIDRKQGLLTLWTVGERSCLSTLVQRKRQAQQKRLWQAIFEDARDQTTLSVALLVQSAFRRGIDDPRAVLIAALRGTLGKVSDELRALFETALRFGELNQSLLSAFNRAYATVTRAGWKLGFDDVVRATVPAPALVELRRGCAAFVASGAASGFRKLPAHGASFFRLIESLTTAAPGDVVALLFDFHGRVQKDRRRGGGWMRRDGASVVIELTTYNGHREDPRFPSFKVPMVQSLLHDVGRLP